MAAFERSQSAALRGEPSPPAFPAAPLIDRRESTGRRRRQEDPPLFLPEEKEDDEEIIVVDPPPAAATSARRGHDEDEEMMRRAIEASMREQEGRDSQSARAGLGRRNEMDDDDEDDDDIEEEEDVEEDAHSDIFSSVSTPHQARSRRQSPPLPIFPFLAGEGANASRDYDDEDAELQAALRASMEGLPEGFALPAWEAVPPAASNVKPDEHVESKEESEVEDEIEIEPVPAPEVELTPQQLRALRLARFGG